MFLKKMHLDGFKSFGRPTEIDFSQPVTGVVGPNGSGKSCVIDAIKWVLGEKSLKQIRSKESTDVIFKGSGSAGAAKYAEVTLYFDNSSKSLHYDGVELNVTKRIDRETKESQYYINGELCRMKDVVEIFLDCGLGRGSLGIISQGEVKAFPEAKPENRRRIFEEAAGIGLYLKDKLESNKHLAVAEENYIRKSDLVNEEATEIKKLVKQAEKANIYNEKKKELTKIDLTILAKDINYYSAKLETVLAECVKLDNLIDKYKPDLETFTQSVENNKKELDTIEVNIDTMTNEQSSITSELNALNFKKTQLTMQLETELSSQNLQSKINAYKTLIASTKQDIADQKNRIVKLEEEVSTFQNINADAVNKFNEMKHQIDERDFELRGLRDQLRNLNNSNNWLDQGVKTIVENKNMFTGFKGLIKDFIAVDEQYEKAIYSALGNAGNNVIIATNFDAQQAINILKQNHGGKATFLPLDDIRARGIKEEYLEVLQNSPGFQGVAAELIKFPREFEAAYRHLLGSTIVADTIENAILISRLTYKLYRVFSLDGDVVNPGGSITGGFNKNSFSKPKMTAEELTKIILDKENEYSALRSQFETFANEQNETLNKINSKNNLKSQYIDSIANLESKLYSYELEYKQYEAQDQNKDGGKSFENELNTNIANLQTKSDKISTELNVIKQQRMLLKSKQDDFSARINDIHSQLDSCRNAKLTSETDKIKCENILANARDKINNTYKLTLEYVQENYRDELPMSDDQARAIILKLQHEIDALGDINFEAIKDLDARQKAYEENVKQLDELKQACDKIKDAIKKLDVKAKKDFINTINNVNNTLPEIFKFLYGGGSCQVTLTDPNDYLNTGIEITVTLPGKTTMPLYLYSGGEQTLITLSILFSILKNKSFPLVILDEAEGALDIANVLRFGKIIRSYSQNTQFVVITHRSGTMEWCNVLFGVTMLASGITSVFNVSVDEAKKKLVTDDDTESETTGN